MAFYGIYQGLGPLDKQVQWGCGKILPCQKKGWPKGAAAPLIACQGRTHCFHGSATQLDAHARPPASAPQCQIRPGARSGVRCLRCKHWLGWAWMGDGTARCRPLR